MQNYLNTTVVHDISHECGFDSHTEQCMLWCLYWYIGNVFFITIDIGLNDVFATEWLLVFVNVMIVVTMMLFDVWDVYNCILFKQKIEHSCFVLVKIADISCHVTGDTCQILYLILPVSMLRVFDSLLKSDIGLNTLEVQVLRSSSLLHQSHAGIQVNANRNCTSNFNKLATTVTVSLIWPSLMKPNIQSIALISLFWYSIACKMRGLYF